MNTITDLQPLSNSSLSDQVENRLREYFVENAFKPGDSLPNEIEIAERLHVSRNIVREALSRLRMLGMIESRPRKGMIMAKPDILGGIERVLNPNILGKDTIKDIIGLRLILEMGMADSLFQKKTSEMISELEDIVKKQNTIEKLSKEDEIEFHGKLYEMSGNETLKRFQILLFPIFDYVYKHIQTQPGRKVKNPVSHLDLLNVLKGGTPDEFRLAMHKHLEPYLENTL